MMKQNQITPEAVIMCLEAYAKDALEIPKAK